MQSATWRREQKELPKHSECEILPTKWAALIIMKKCRRADIRLLMSHRPTANTFHRLHGYFRYWRKNFRVLSSTVPNRCMGRVEIVDYPFGARIIFLILALPVYKMWIIQEPNKLAVWNKLHFEEKKRRV